MEGWVRSEDGLGRLGGSVGDVLDNMDFGAKEHIKFRGSKIWCWNRKIEFYIKAFISYFITDQGKNVNIC